MDRGIDRLRRRRGAERATFDEVADHIVDFVKVHPSAERTLDDFAAYLATVESVAHEHRGDGSSAPEAGLT